MAKRRKAPPSPGDLQLLRFYSQSLDRAAFQDEIRQEGSMEDFDKAMEGTITAINTGCLRSRDGAVLATAKGKSYLDSSEWREALDAVVDLLGEIRTRYATGIQTGKIHIGEKLSNGDQWYCFNDPSLADWFDEQRAEVIRLFNQLCDEAGIPSLVFPRPRRRFGY